MFGIINYCMRGDTDMWEAEIETRHLIPQARRRIQSWLRKFQVL